MSGEAVNCPLLSLVFRRHCGSVGLLLFSSGSQLPHGVASRKNPKPTHKKISMHNSNTIEVDVVHCVLRGFNY